MLCIFNIMFQDDVSRKIIHYHYTAWPDKSAPESISSLIHVRNVMKEHKSENKERPILVHCRYIYSILIPKIKLNNE